MIPRFRERASDVIEYWGDNCLAGHQARLAFSDGERGADQQSPDCDGRCPISSSYPSGVEPTPIAAHRRLLVVVMGVAGSGKSTIAAGIAELLSLPFIEGDELHSPLSVAKMKAGIALEDEDRWPWLDRIAARLADKEWMPLGLVITCSALKRSYRDRIRRGAPGVRFVFLHGPSALIESRLAARTDHFMPSTLLASQLQTLEPPGPDEDDVLHSDIGQPPAAAITLAASALSTAAPR